MILEGLVSDNLTRTEPLHTFLPTEPLPPSPNDVEAVEAVEASPLLVTGSEQSLEEDEEAGMVGGSQQQEPLELLRLAQTLQQAHRW